MLQNLLKNKILFWLGSCHLLAFLVLFVYSFFNDEIILGINSMFKPIKFALSIWIYSWTMSLILNFVDDKKKVKHYSFVAFICMSFEQIAITYQAFKGELSHFNTSNTFGIVLFSLMGLFILTITLWTAYIAFIFAKQRNHNVQPSLVMGIKIGLLFFVVFSLFGGYISSLSGHTIGAPDGGSGRLFFNWSLYFGDLRVAHFFGIHSLQVIPLFAYFMSTLKNQIVALKMVQFFSIFYLIFILFTLAQGFMAKPF